MAQELHDLFRCSVDVQAGGNLTGALLEYVTGYAAKAATSLNWRARECASDLTSFKWVTVYRLLCKRAPLVPEIVVDLYSVPMIHHSYLTAKV
mgnify:CR=1 FL=1